MSLKHLGAGSERPPLQNGLIRLYSMAFCPYAQRARLVLAAKNIPHELVNIKLRADLPEWYLAINPSRTVPALQLDENRSIPESLIVAEYLDDSCPENKLKSNDPYVAAQNKLAIETFNKFITAYYKVLLQADPNAHETAISALQEFVKFLKDDYLGGKSPSFGDYMVWPWLERVEVLKKFRNLQLPADLDAKLTPYIQRMLTHPGVQKCFLPAETHIKFYQGYLSTPPQPNYDAFLE